MVLRGAGGGGGRSHGTRNRERTEDSSGLEVRKEWELGDPCLCPTGKSHVCRFIGCGRNEKFNYVVMQLQVSPVGSSLHCPPESWVVTAGVGSRAQSFGDEAGQSIPVVRRGGAQGS